MTSMSGRLHYMVCGKKLGLSAAQEEIAPLPQEKNDAPFFSFAIDGMWEPPAAYILLHLAKNTILSRELYIMFGKSKISHILPAKKYIGYFNAAAIGLILPAGLRGVAKQDVLIECVYNFF